MYLVVPRSPGRNRTSAHWNQNPAAIANAAQGTTLTNAARLGFEPRKTLSQSQVGLPIPPTSIDVGRLPRRL